MEDKQQTPVIIRGMEDGDKIELTAGSRETAERLVAQMKEQGLTDLTIDEAH